MKIVRRYRRTKRRARRYGIAALLAAIVGVLGACSSQPALPPLGELREPSYTAAPADTTTVTVAGEIGDGIPETAYLLTLDEGGIYYVTDEAALALGRTVCDFLDAGASSTEAAATIDESSDYTAYESGYITGAAIGSFCPEHA